MNVWLFMLYNKEMLMHNDLNIFIGAVVLFVIYSFIINAARAMFFKHYLLYTKVILYQNI